MVYDLSTMNYKSSSSQIESLYFIAILAPPAVAEQVTAIKNEFAQRFESRHGLKLPPHITLQPPFRFHSDKLETFKNALSLHFKQHSYIKVVLNDFGCFAKRRNPVIFIKLQENYFLQAFHHELMRMLREIGFPNIETPLEFHPHMTIAHRDLSRPKFNLAWPEFAHRNFYAEFDVSAIHLLRHDGKFWIPVAEFPLRNGQ
jgi:2'-5' RNA ligase